jgi:branched-chain amino acid transport system substrate-binding protein
MKRHTLMYLVWLAAMGAVVLAACSKVEPIRLGFVAGLSGRVADLGVPGRNGAILAIEQRNAAGGINGHPVELLVKDDEQNPETARRVVAELLSQKTEAVIGPMTSSMAIATISLVNSSKSIMVSPTVTTTELAGKDDNFLRVISVTTDYAGKSARYQVEKLGHRTAAVLYDIGNKSYTESWLKDFRKVFEASGGQILKVQSFQSGSNFVFYESVKELLQVKPDVVVVITNAVDSALICQQVRKLDARKPIVMSEWASTERFVELAGSAAEGVHVSQFLDRNDTSARYLAFRKAYLARFAAEPGFAGLASYDAAMVVLDAYARRKAGQTLKEAILAASQFQGVQQTITFDPFGEANRKTFVAVIRNGQYVTLE